MQNITIIENAPLVIKELNGQRVITFKDIDELHQRPEGTADRNFRENQKRFIAGVDYYKLNKNQNNEFRGLEIPNRGLIVITETGYPMLVKSFNDDLAWAVQRALVNSYFKGKINPQPTDFLEACGVIPPITLPLTDEDITRQFLQAISKALESGEYYLIRKKSRQRRKDSILLGLYDDTYITIVSTIAGEIYARAVGDTRSIKTINQCVAVALTNTGAMEPRGRGNCRRNIGDNKKRSCIRLYRQRLNAICGFSLPKLIAG